LLSLTPPSLSRGRAGERERKKRKGRLLNRGSNSLTDCGVSFFSPSLSLLPSFLVPPIWLFPTFPLFRTSPAISDDNGGSGGGRAAAAAIKRRRRRPSGGGVDQAAAAATVSPNANQPYRRPRTASLSIPDIYFRVFLFTASQEMHRHFTQIDIK